ncbi:NDR1/HIN1-like protein 26 [Telopea speciosissima]|uniref:NDR1/HIN1-like protein 26 n=1 Tax=Telopea speciosissima TaxID=54955 RepID=UPI001CC36212|nr:NDR1/HIN1-like protein 26 [Telopea speciosissima]
MSKFLAKSPKHCAEKHGFFNIERLPKKLLYAFSTFLLSVFSLIFIVWLILRPSKPEFYLKEADIYQLDLTDPHLLNSSIQITLVSMNPNKKVGIYYDQLQVYASYKGQQITVYTSLPPFYQGHQDSNLLTASLVGAGLPVAPSLGYEVGRDQTAGTLILSLKVNGRLRWKVWTWVSGRYRFNVDCVAIIAFRPNVVVPPTLTSSKLGSQCSTIV